MGLRRVEVVRRGMRGWVRFGDGGGTVDAGLGGKESTKAGVIVDEDMGNEILRIRSEDDI